jgi:hypothetical protein
MPPDLPPTNERSLQPTSTPTAPKTMPEAAKELFVQLDQRLEEILSGSSTRGRWLDSQGQEVAEDAPGAVWTEYDLDDQNIWLETVAGHIASLKQIGAQLRELVLPEVPAHGHEELETPEKPRG